jgi:hypothetical protein
MDWWIVIRSIGEANPNPAPCRIRGDACYDEVVTHLHRLRSRSRPDQNSLSPIGITLPESSSSRLRAASLTLSAPASSRLEGGKVSSSQAASFARLASGKFATDFRISATDISRRYSIVDLRANFFDPKLGGSCDPLASITGIVQSNWIDSGTRLLRARPPPLPPLLSGKAQPFARVV